jgi:uncharacterized protein with PIN domain
VTGELRRRVIQPAVEKLAGEKDERIKRKKSRCRVCGAPLESQHSGG